MSKFIGRKIEVGIGKETTRGTAVTPSYWLSKMNADFDDKFEGVIDENSIGVIEDAQDFKVTKKWSEGKISGRVCDKSFGLILLASLGTASSAETADTGVYEHTYSVQQDAQHDSLTIEGKNPNEQKAFANGMIKSLSLKAELGKFIDFTASIIAKLGSTSSNTPSYTSENSFLAKDATIKFASNKSGLSSASAVSVKSVELNIEKNVESDDVLGNVEPEDFLNKQFAITGTIELIYNATTYKDLALAGTEKAIRLTLEDSNVTIGASSHPTLQIDLAKVKLTEWTKTSENDEIVKETLTFKAFYSSSDSEMIEAILTNTVADYN